MSIGTRTPFGSWTMINIARFLVTRVALRPHGHNAASDNFVCLAVPGSPAAMPLVDVRTHETVHIEVGDCLIDVDGLKRAEDKRVNSS